MNHRKREKADGETSSGEKQLFAFGEKRQNLSVIGQGPGQIYLMGCTRLDPMTYMLFGAYHIEVTEYGLECDEWLPVIGHADALDDIQRLKVLMEGCLLRVFEGIHMSKIRPSRPGESLSRRVRDIQEDESGDDDSEPKDRRLSAKEIKELDYMTRDIVRILDKYSKERRATQSRRNSRPATPTMSPHMGASRLLGPSSANWRSGTSTPFGHGFDSRPGTPSQLSRRD